MAVPAWSFDIATGEVRYAADGSTFATVPNVISATLAVKYTADANVFVPILVMTVKDVAGAAVVLGQSSALGSDLSTIAGYVPTKETRSAAGDHINVRNGGVDVLQIVSGGWPAAGVESVLASVDAPYKQPV